MSHRPSYLNQARAKTDSVPFWLVPIIILLFMVIGAVIVFPFALLGALIFQQIWNLGLVALVAACGGTVAKIGFWTAFWVNLIWASVLRAIRGRTRAEA